MTSLCLAQGKGQAFVEFGDVASAQAMVAYWAAGSGLGPTVRGRHVFCQFSNHRELRTEAPAAVGAEGVGAVLRVIVVSPPLPPMSPSI